MVEQVDYCPRQGTIQCSEISAEGQGSGRFLSERHPDT